MSVPGAVYTVYEAKAKFSELVRRVRQGERVTITYHGKPVAELGPIPPREGSPGLDERLAELERSGAASPAAQRPAAVDWSPVAMRPGALGRFLAERE